MVQINDISQEIGYQIGKYYIGPAIFSYVKWVLDQALEKRIDTLYFMARDGYLMYQCACILCAENPSYKVACRYFLCSRLSLRLPSYFKMPYDKVIDSLFSKGYELTLSKIMDRVLFSTDEKKEIQRELGTGSLDEILSVSQLTIYKKICLESDTFRQRIMNKACNTYTNVIGYIRECGMLDSESIAIVDSGWLGSIQDSLSMLLKSAGFRRKLTGFYFGMYKERVNDEHNEFCSYFFDAKKELRRKARFNNNIFEILCSGNHGMTIGYTCQDGVYEPILDCYTSCLEKEEVQIGALENEEIIPVSEIDRRFYNLMHIPHKAYADYIGRILFSDNLSDSNMIEMAPIITCKQCRHLIFPVRLALEKKKYCYSELRIYWPEGSIVRSGVHLSKFYLFNIYFWNWVRFFKRKFRNI